MRRIAVEEHFTTQEYVDCLQSIIDQKYPVAEVNRQGKNLLQEVPWLQMLRSSSQDERAEIQSHKLLDLGPVRIKDMDEAGIDVQVLSLTVPGVQVLDPAGGTAMARNINDYLAGAINPYPGRFIGLACVAPQDPAGAAAELRRAVTELGFKGVSINSHTGGEYLDEKKFRPILEAAAELNVPLYLHPRRPAPKMIEPYMAYPGLAGAILGYAAEVSLHALRLIFSGVFDEFPNLKVVLGHLGESLPFMLWRIDLQWQRRSGGNITKKKPSDYLRENFFVSTSGLFWQPALLCSHLALGAERILFAVDYPFVRNGDAVSFMDAAPISTADKEKILHKNAEGLFHL